MQFCYFNEIQTCGRKERTVFLFYECIPVKYIILQLNHVFEKYRAVSKQKRRKMNRPKHWAILRRAVLSPASAPLRLPHVPQPHKKEFIYFERTVWTVE